MFSVVDENTSKDEKGSNWKDKYKFPPGAILLIVFQLISGMGVYFFILVMPIYMVSMLGFSDTKSTVIYHAKSGLAHILNIAGAVIADSFLGRVKTYLLLQPLDLLVMLCIVILSIYKMTTGIITFYFIIAIVGGLFGPALRALIADQIPAKNVIMLSTYLHIIYFINNFGIIIVAYIAPIMHKDIHCFGVECYPLIFFVSFILIAVSFILFLFGYFCKMFVIHKPTESLIINIFRCIHISIKRRIKFGKPENGKSFLDYAEGDFDASFIKDLKIAKGLCVFLLAHPLFWTVFEQLSSVWTLQAQYMNGMISETFVLKADQMQTLNPFFVVILIPFFEMIVYPLLNKIHFKIPYRIVAGQIFTALACVSMIFIQLSIDSSIDSPISIDKTQINLANMGVLNVSVSSGMEKIQMEPSKISSVTFVNANFLLFDSGTKKLNKTLINQGRLLTAVIVDSNIGYDILISDVKIQKNGGYAWVRVLNLIEVSNLKLTIKGKVGINILYNLNSKNQEFGNYVKCGVGIFDVFLNDNGKEKYIGKLTLYPAQSKTIIVSGSVGSEKLVEISESMLKLPNIIWQVIPYILLTIGEILFNINTGIFLYGEAPMSMKSIILAGEYVCIAIGNILILLLKQILTNLSGVYLFFICSILVTISGIFTGILGYFYMENKNRVTINEGDEIYISKL